MAQEALVERRGAGRGAAHAIVQLLVLGEQRGELGHLFLQFSLLGVDGVVGAPDQRREQREDREGHDGLHGPTAHLRRAQVLLQIVGGSQIGRLRYSPHGTLPR
ncbi:MAG: hypothetical protein HYU75_06625 [Betaproteobacteria bacterium]|nr:hypothetical protein [Betaproteobacteria bacterium]